MNQFTSRRSQLALILIACLLMPLAARAASETVMVTFRAKPGAEAALAEVIERHWATARKLNLVIESPHLTLRGSEKEGGTYFIDIFTWRDAAAPDQAPAAIKSIWDEMNKLVETRHGQEGLSFETVSPVASARHQ